MKIAILYICTGKYTVFWDGFYKSSEVFFLPNHEKHYFVFTDGNINSYENNKVHIIEQQKLGWPFDTLKRFHMFDQIKETLKDFDFIVFINSNSVFLQEISDSFFPKNKNELLVTTHPGLFKRFSFKTIMWRLLFAYERNKKSTAYIPFMERGTYVCGGLNGGYTEEYLKLISALKDAIDIDLQNNIIAKWHDESHLNKYILNKKYKLLHPGYMFPPGYHMPFPKVISILDKKEFGGHDFLRT